MAWRFWLLLLGIWTAALQNGWAQPDYGNPEKYEIGGIEVVGNEYTDPNGIISVSGLVQGNEIQIPGDDLARAIRKLWKQGLFVDVQIFVTKTVGEQAFLQISVKEYARFARHGYKGVKKGQHDDLNEAVNRYLVKGKAATPTMKTNAIQAIRSYYIDKGFLDAKISVSEEPDQILKNSVRLVFDINRGRRVPISHINFVGNSTVKAKRLRRSMKETKQRTILSIFKPSKFIEKEFENDKKSIIAYYNTIGRRDARILRDSVYLIETKKGDKIKKTLGIDIVLEEGTNYYFGDITIRGNTTYSTKDLMTILGIKKGMVYNEELLQSRISFDRNGRDLSTLYMDNGYLFFRADPVEKGIRNDSVDIEIRISEGPIATIDRVIIKGNDRTHEHVIRRELRVLPGDKFSRSAIIRSQREIMALNYFNPETMTINTPVNPQRGTVDIEFGVEERPSDQLELSAGWGGLGRGVIGTLGVTFNNFSLRNMFKPEAWTPLPQGDGQQLSLRIQTNGRFYQSYNFSFTEPWLGGKKPTAFSLSAYMSRFNNGLSRESSSFSQLVISGVSAAIGTRLRWPDDYFTSQTSLNYKNMDLTRRFDFTIPTGVFHNFNISQTISRNSIDDPTFPTKGSVINFTAELTPPYSLFTPNRDYSALSPSEKFKFIEYHKWDIEATWYTPILPRNRNFVIKASAKLGFLGFYNSKVGLSPFERYELGGDGLSNFVGLQGRDIISLRGYRDPVLDVSASNRLGSAIFNKFTLEFRYRISPNPSASIYVLAFLEGGNAWASFKDYNPFDLKRSAGVGLRVFLPMFGTLGFDYGFGFDKPHLGGSKKWTDYGAFNIVLGFEPR